MSSPVASTGRPHLSATQLDLSGKCLEAYRRRYIEGHKIPPGIAISKGKSIHLAAEANFGQKIETHRDLPVSEVIDLSVSSFDEQVHAPEFEFTLEEKSQGGEIVIGHARDAVADMAKVYAESQAPEYQPLFVELEVTIPMPDAPRDLLAKIDLIDDQKRVIDFKTGGKAKTQADADTAVQLTVYAAAHLVQTGEPATDLRFDTIVQTKTRTKRVVTNTTRGPADFQALANRINVTLAQVDAGIFPPTTPGAWWCSPKWCGYWATCPYVNSERIAKSEDE